MKKNLIIPIILLTLLLTACASDTRSVDRRIRNTESTETVELGETQTDEDTYIIGKGDILEVTTWKEEDFTREVPVRIDGKISFPLVGDLQAAGRTTEAVTASIQEQLKEFVTHPVVSVAVKVPVSQKFYIIGEIVKPGEYPLAKDLTVMQAFALAGGFTEWAGKNEIIVIRRKNEMEQKIRVNYQDIIKGRALHQDIPLKADDIIVVP